MTIEHDDIIHIPTSLSCKSIAATIYKINSKTVNTNSTNFTVSQVKSTIPTIVSHPTVGIIFNVKNSTVLISSKCDTTLSSDTTIRKYNILIDYIFLFFLLTDFYFMIKLPE